jgi:hypothetical protein
MRLKTKPNTFYTFYSFFLTSMLMASSSLRRYLNRMIANTDSVTKARKTRRKVRLKLKRNSLSFDRAIRLLGRGYISV